MASNVLCLLQVIIAMADGHLQVAQPAIEPGGEPTRLNVKVVLIAIFSDYRGLASIVGPSIKQAPAKYGCLKSWLLGKTVPGYKTICNIHAE